MEPAELEAKATDLGQTVHCQNRRILLLEERVVRVSLEAQVQQLQGTTSTVTEAQRLLIDNVSSAEKILTEQKFSAIQATFSDIAGAIKDGTLAPDSVQVTVHEIGDFGQNV
eukprot:2733193-Rhodomonas_salina.2